MEDRYLVIYNECSGGKKLINRKQMIRKFFTQENIWHEFILLTKEKPHITDLDLSQILLQKKITKILVAGGDGTLRRTVEYLYQKNLLLPIGFLPSGSANTYARILDLPLQPQRILKNLLKRRHKHMSLGVLNDKHIFLWAACFGKIVEPTVEAEMYHKDFFGGLSYLLTTMKAVRKFPQIPLSFRIDHKRKTHTHAHSAFVLLNEGANVFVPLTKKWKGELKFFLLKNENLVGFINLLCQIYMLKRTSKNADVLSGRSVLIEGDFERKIHLDGDTFEEHPGTYKIEVLDEVVTFLC